MRGSVDCASMVVPLDHQPSNHRGVSPRTPTDVKACSRSLSLAKLLCATVHIEAAISSEFRGCCSEALHARHCITAVWGEVDCKHTSPKIALISKHLDYGFQVGVLVLVTPCRAEELPRPCSLLATATPKCTDLKKGRNRCFPAKADVGRPAKWDLETRMRHTLDIDIDATQKQPSNALLGWYGQEQVCLRNRSAYNPPRPIAIIRPQDRRPPPPRFHRHPTSQHSLFIPSRASTCDTHRYLQYTALISTRSLSRTTTTTNAISRFPDLPDPTPGPRYFED